MKKSKFFGLIVTIVFIWLLLIVMFVPSKPTYEVSNKTVSLHSESTDQGGRLHLYE